MTTLTLASGVVTAVTLLIHIWMFQHVSPTTIVTTVLDDVYNGELDSRLLLVTLLTVIVFVQISLASKTFGPSLVSEMETLVYGYGLYDIVGALINAYLWLPLWRHTVGMLITAKWSGEDPFTEAYWE